MKYPPEIFGATGPSNNEGRYQVRWAPMPQQEVDRIARITRDTPMDEVFTPVAQPEEADWREYYFDTQAEADACADYLSKNSTFPLIVEGIDLDAVSNLLNDNREDNEP